MWGVRTRSWKKTRVGRANIAPRASPSLGGSNLTHVTPSPRSSPPPPRLVPSSLRAASSHVLPKGGGRRLKASGRGNQTGALLQSRESSQELKERRGEKDEKTNTKLLLRNTHAAGSFGANKKAKKGLPVRASKEDQRT